MGGPNETSLPTPLAHVDSPGGVAPLHCLAFSKRAHAKGPRYIDPPELWLY